jgi:hypothetical protein
MSGSSTSNRIHNDGSTREPESRVNDTGFISRRSAPQPLGYNDFGQDPIGTIMDRPNTILVYSDYKSPYAFLAKDLIYELEDQFDVHLEWLPYTLDIPSYLGSARLDERGEIIESSRNAHQWRRVRYSYMDCRRQARKRGLVILGTRKIWDSSLAAIGMLWAKRQGKRQFCAYHDRVFERFWNAISERRRALNAAAERLTI